MTKVKQKTFVTHIEMQRHKISLGDITIMRIPILLILNDSCGGDTGFEPVTSPCIKGT